jgi:hypothetical protein
MSLSAVDPPMPASDAFPARGASSACKARANEKKNDSPNPRYGREFAGWSRQNHWPVFNDESRSVAHWCDASDGLTLPRPAGVNRGRIEIQLAARDTPCAMNAQTSPHATQTTVRKP